MLATLKQNFFSAKNFVQAVLLE